MHRLSQFRRALVLAGVLLSGGAAAAAQGTGSPALAASASIEQTAPGSRPALAVLDAFDGLGADRFAGDDPAAQSLRQQPRGRSRPRHADGELAGRDLHEGGTRFDATAGCFRPGRHAQRLHRLRRGVRQPRQRRRRRALRPAGRPLAGGDADLPPRGRARPARPVAPIAPPGEAARPGQAVGPRARRRVRPPPPQPAGVRRRRRRRAVRDLLRRQHRRPIPLGDVPPLRLRAAALSRLPAPGGLARRLLRAHQHRRRGHREARLRRRPREDARRPAGHRAVRRRRRRELPQHRRPRRHDAAARRARPTW